MPSVSSVLGGDLWCYGLESWCWTQFFGFRRWEGRLWRLWVALVAFCLVSLLLFFFDRNQVTKCHCWWWHTTYSAFLQGGVSAARALLHSFATWWFSMKLVSAEAPGKEPRLALLVPGLGKIRQVTGSHRKPYEGRQDTRWPVLTLDSRYQSGVYWMILILR